MARVNLKGVAKVNKRLASGERVSYWYAWRGGPRLDGQPGTAEFIASYNAAIASRKTEIRQTATLGWICDKFQDSPEFTGTAEKTRKDYARHLDEIRREFAPMTFAEIEMRGSRSLFLEWRDEIAAKRGTRTADYVFAVLARALSWAKDREHIERNPCERAGRLHGGNRKESIWTLDEEAAFLATASRPMRLAFLLALWTAQREGDIIRMTWRAYDGKSLMVRQGKTGAAVRIPVAGVLKSTLDTERAANARRAAPALHILATDRGNRAYTADGFRASFRAACEAAGIAGRTFHDLRGTFVTRAAEGGATEAERAAVTGHGLNRNAMNVNYLSLTYSMAQSCISKLEKWHEAATSLQTELQTGGGGIG